eukprot:10828516-Alexandrium_andersonii.AAC.1
MTKSMCRGGPGAPLAARWPREVACGAERTHARPALAQTAASGAATSSCPRRSALKSPETRMS